MKTLNFLIIVFSVATITLVSSTVTKAQEAKIFVNNLECLELENSSMQNSVRVKVAPCSTSALQDFTIIGTSGNSVNIKISSTRCIEILGADTRNGVAVTQWNCDDDGH